MRSPNRRSELPERQQEAGCQNDETDTDRELHREQPGSLPETGGATLACTACAEQIRDTGRMETTHRRQRPGTERAPHRDTDDCRSRETDRRGVEADDLAQLLCLQIGETERRTPGAQDDSAGRQKSQEITKPTNSERGVAPNAIRSARSGNRARTRVIWRFATFAVARRTMATHHITKAQSAWR